MREFQGLLEDAVERLLEQHFGRHLFLPLPVSHILEHNIANDSIELRLAFFNPEGEYVFGFDPRRARLQGVRPQDLDRVLPQMIEHAYNNALRQRDETLFAQVWRTSENTAQLNPCHELLMEDLRRYYAEEARYEPYFSLRRLEEQEAHYARQFNLSIPTDGVELLEWANGPRRTHRYDIEDLARPDTIVHTQASLNLYPNEEVATEVIERRAVTVRRAIAAIMAGQEDPRFFTNRVERYLALCHLERPAVNFRVERLLERWWPRPRRNTGVGYTQTATEVRARAAASAAMLQRLDDTTTRLWGAELHRALRNNLMFGTWDVAGRDERLTDAERAAAEDRGMKLLLENLTREQREQYARTQSFYVIGGVTGRTYEITRGRSQNVWHVDPETKQKMQGYCFLPAGNLCIGDTMLTQKIALELEENKALKVAIKFGGNILRQNPIRGDYYS